MASSFLAQRVLAQEARALLTRLDRLRPYALHMPMVTAAAISPAAQAAIESHMSRSRARLRLMVQRYLHWLRGPQGLRTTPAEAQRRFTLVRLRFNALLSQFEIFADVLTQRSEHETGVWVAGLDDVAADALEIPGNYFKAPPVICYVTRGHGAAIRRARTRLPGGDQNPVAVISMPRERMVGSGIASSLVHEVGHQAAALLDLVNSLRLVLQGEQLRAVPEQRLAWNLWERWASEILADFWSVAKLGIGATLGLIGVVSLPRAFVFRMDWEDPHPIPWIRVKLSCAMGQELYPHPQWDGLDELWESFYPRAGLDEQRKRVLAMLESTIPRFVSLLLNHRPRTLRGSSLREVMPVEDRQPARLAAYNQAWGASPQRLQQAPPTLAFAVIGQARADGRMTPEEESNILASLLTFWAVRSALDTSAICATRPSPRRRPETSRLPGEFQMSFQ
jgi:hypothetical protein